MVFGRTLAGEPRAVMCRVTGDWKQSFIYSTEKSASQWRV